MRIVSFTNHDASIINCIAVTEVGGKNVGGAAKCCSYK